MTDVPEVVTSALAQRETARMSEARGPGLPTRVTEGDLRAIESLTHRSDDHRIGLVVRVDSTSEFVEVLLVHTAPELAAQCDLVVPSDVTSAPYDVVVQTDLRGVVWTLQLGERVGHLTEPALAAVRAIDNSLDGSEHPVAPAPSLFAFYTGIPLRGLLDGRWSFKESEGVAFRALTADCTEALLDEEFAWEVNPGLLQPELLDLADDPEMLLVELLHWAQTRRLSLTDDDLDLLLEVGALKIESWIQISDLGADLLTGLQEVLLRAATGVDSEVQTEVQCMLTASHLGTSDKEASHDQIHYLAAKEPVTL